MSNTQVLCIGEVLFDCLADQPGKSLPEVESWTAYPGGAPANVACALVKLGTSAGFIGCLGEDEPGNSLVKLFQEIGVDVTGIQRHPKAPTRQVYVLRSHSGDRQFAGFGNLDTGDFADTRLNVSQLPETLFQDVSFLVSGTLELAYPRSREAIEKAVQLAKQNNVKVLVDVNWRPVFWPNPDLAPGVILKFLQQADFVKLSDEEAEWLFNTTDPSAIAKQLPHLQGVLVTAGEAGCSYYLANNSDKIPAFSVKVVDTTGAGDSFVAGFIHQLCQQGTEALTNADTAKNMVIYASAVGAITTMKAGAIAAQPTPEEVEEFLSVH
ncbi:carbohydrate kinase [Phormidium sp. LEGE 05292]|uniref:carbohydrate kinase family protein n=1 Tax=[Phormidium] sp. LEGE 05292 TaxID=767427 RepID=UPI00187F5A5E|nr:carbohydrate kinase [Phormidium sp. LEGE 05292]MBE9225362.1 carbohydrate kinase [Phormidium sp. LEGE 05292]